ncbi:hypothetical protein ACQ4PT_055015 [Festuca glaucescens]
MRSSLPKPEAGQQAKPSLRGPPLFSSPASRFADDLMGKKSKAAAAAASDSGASSPQGSVEGGGEKEGSFLLGQPTWKDAGGGRWRCAETGHELPEREKDAYARSRACRLALIDHGVAHKKPPLNAFKPPPRAPSAYWSKLVCNITGDTINKSEEHIWKHVNGKRFLNKLEKLEEKLTSGETAEVQGEQSNEVAKKSKSSKKDKKKAAVVNPSLPREPEPEMDDSDDPEFWSLLLDVVGTMMMGKTDGNPLRGRMMSQRMKVHLMMRTMLIWLRKMMKYRRNWLQGPSDCQ